MIIKIILRKKCLISLIEITTKTEYAILVDDIEFQTKYILFVGQL